MARRPNRNGPTPLGVTMTLLPHERRMMKLNTTKGGAQNIENWIVSNTDPVTGECKLDPVRLTRVINICNGYGPGGPNGRVRNACIPALRRAGIELRPGWTVDE